MDQLVAYEPNPNMMHYTTHFIDGLKHAARVIVAVQRPLDLDIAYCIASVQEEVGEGETERCAKELECSQAVQECERLTKELADQAERHKAELKNLKDGEAHLQAEFETQRSNWAEKEKFLTDGYGEIEDMIDGNLFLLLEKPPTDTGVGLCLLIF